MADIKGSAHLSKQALAGNVFAHMCLLPYRRHLHSIPISS